MPLLSSSKTMDGSATLSVHAQNVLKECDTSLLPATKHSSSHRTPSFSSFSSCSFSEFPDDFPPNPATPRRFSGVPFSWEHLPGIPKKPSCKKKDSTVVKALPLPPHTSKRFNLEEVGIIRKKNSKESFGKDPFFTALVECSKGDDEEDHSGSNFWNVTKVSRSISGRFGFINIYTSCKRTCAVSDSIVYLPRSRRTSYGQLISCRSS